jgi:hypothetical protein
MVYGLGGGLIDALSKSFPDPRKECEITVKQILSASVSGQFQDMYALSQSPYALHSPIPNYGDRYRYGEMISTAFAESTVNQVVSKRMVKKQQMRWTRRGAHLLLQVRTQVLNGDWRDTFCRWYPSMSKAVVSFYEQSRG